MQTDAKGSKVCGSKGLQESALNKGLHHPLQSGMFYPQYLQAPVSVGSVPEGQVQAASLLLSRLTLL